MEFQELENYYFFNPILTLSYTRSVQFPTFVIHCNKLSNNICHKTYCINDRKNRNCTHVSVQLQAHKTYNQNISDLDIRQFAMQCILKILECVSHIKLLQGLSNKRYKNNKDL